MYVNASAVLSSKAVDGSLFETVATCHVLVSQHSTCIRASARNMHNLTDATPRASSDTCHQPALGLSL